MPLLCRLEGFAAWFYGTKSTTSNKWIMVLEHSLIDNRRETQSSVHYESNVGLNCWSVYKQLSTIKSRSTVKQLCLKAAFVENSLWQYLHLQKDGQQLHLFQHSSLILLLKCYAAVPLHVYRVEPPIFCHRKEYHSKLIINNTFTFLRWQIKSDGVNMNKIQRSTGRVALEY